MKENKICFISCVNDQRIYKEAVRYISALTIPEGYEIDVISVDNAMSMAAGYNFAIQSTDAKYKVYLQQNVFILNKAFLVDTIELFKKYHSLGMIGVIGAKDLPQSGVWWESKNCYGRVYRKVNGLIDTVSFEEVEDDYESVLTIDGLLMMTQYDIPWREDIFNGWHFYDTSQSLEFIKAGLEVGIPKQPKTWVLHDSGETLKDGYLMNQEIFIKEYGNYLDCTISLDNNHSSFSERARSILAQEQNDVRFTGERIVINKEVKEKYNNVLQEHIIRYDLACEFVAGKIVLDAACGTGYGTKMLEEAGAEHIVGIDISEESVRNAASAYQGEKIEFVQGDVTHLPFEDNKFDIVVSFETIEHIDDGASWIRESARVLKDGGLFIVSTPNRTVTNPGTYFEERPLNPHHRFEYSSNEFLGELLKEYEIVQVYGQTYIHEKDSIITQIVRKYRELDSSYIPQSFLGPTGHQLIPFGEIKDAQPMYVVAICRKRAKNGRF